MVQPGKVLERGSLIWRNQAGPVNSWIKLNDIEKNWENIFFTNLFVLGLPDSISSPYIQKYSKSLEVLGIRHLQHLIAYACRIVLTKAL